MTHVSSTTRPWHSIALLLVALVVTALAYRPGTGGSLQFDDPHNLSGLSQVVDASSAFEFAISGHAGPTGRPLALASFAPQAYAWPHSPEVFLHTNIYLHLLNGALVIWLLYRLCLARRMEERRSAFVAVTAGALWMLLPILASSSLFIVQRMTVLSTTFLLLGFIGYLYARRTIERGPLSSITLMTFALGAGTALATLAKENGALLPVLVLVTELTLLTPPSLDTKRTVVWRAWFASVLVAPAVLLLAYLSMQIRYPDSVVLMRGFSGPDRLLTEAGILFEYLFRAFFPIVQSLGPFQDDQLVRRDWLDPSSILAVGAWFAAITAAIVWRRKFPWFSFAVAWYVVGHALESTTIALELYFEHRNYVPLMGPVVALVAAATAVAPQWQRLIKGLLWTYAALLAAVLFSTTSLWGNPPLAAEMWSRYHPDSLRATLYLSGELQKAQYAGAARNIMTEYANRHPLSGTAHLQVLDLSCGIEPNTPQPQQVQRLKGMLSKAMFEYAVFESLQRMHEHAHNGACDAVLDGKTIYELASIVETNPVFHGHALMRHNLNVLMAEESVAQRDLDRAMGHLEAALDAYYTVTTLKFAVDILNSAGLQSVAADFISDSYAHIPSNSVAAAFWRQEIAALEQTTRMAAHYE